MASKCIIPKMIANLILFSKFNSQLVIFKIISEKYNIIELIENNQRDLKIQPI